MDKTKCINENCKIKNDCLRFTAPQNITNLIVFLMKKIAYSLLKTND